MITCGTQVVAGSSGGSASLPDDPATVLLDAGAPSTMLGLNSSGVGEALSAAAARSRMGVAATPTATPSNVIAGATAGGVMITDASGNAKVATGTLGYAMVSNGPGVEPTFQSLSTPTWLALYGASAFYMGGDSAFGFAQADRLSASAAAASPAFGPGQSIVIVLYPGATPTGSEMVIAHTTAAAARGWYVSLGSNAGARTRVGLFFAGLAAGSETSLTGSEAAAGSPYAIAITVKADKSIRYSVNGGAVQTVAALAGSYTAPTSADTLRIGSPSEFAPTYYPLTSALVAAIRCYSTEISDADLVAACADRALGTIPTVATGTVTHDFSAAAFVGGVRTVVASPAPTWISAGGVAIRPKA